MNARRPLYTGFLTLLLLFTLFVSPAKAQGVDAMTLLIPDNVATFDPRVSAWQHAASEEGFGLQVITDSQFLQAGANAPSLYRGLILPDWMHPMASDALASAIQAYVTAGGRAMLVYDFGMLTDGGFFPVPKSRFSGLAGVDYVLYEALRDRTTGLGAVTGMESALRTLQVPPGKSMPYTPATRARDTATSNVLTTGNGRLGSNQAMYLPVSRSDPGGAKGFDYRQYAKVKHKKPKKYRGVGFRATTTADPLTTSPDFGGTVVAPKLATSTTLAATLNAQLTAAATSGDTLHAITGYGFGYLIYPSFATQGTYSGTPLMTSENFGLVAGKATTGQGEVLFINLPLSYLKGWGTDGMLMHGFLRYFGSSMLKLPRLSNQPYALAGMMLNWHLDSMEAQQPMQDLKNQGVWKHGPFSMHMTAGPDTIVPGDKLGFDLPNNPTAQQALREYDLAGHQVASHGGWIHDYYGKNASETNQAEFMPYLILNKNAVEAVIGHAMIEYSAPEGNNPTWAVDWLESIGLYGYYFTGHTGLGPTLAFRDGYLRNPWIWAMPVMSYGQYATFEEFEEFLVPDADVLGWYKKLIDFCITNRTSRLIYMHPPGAVGYPNLLKSMLTYAQNKKTNGKFAWFTIADMGYFMTLRRDVVWDVTVAAGGNKEFNASHPSTLGGMVWMLPRAQYNKPTILSGSAQIKSDTTTWYVTATSGKALKFQSKPIP